MNPMTCEAVQEQLDLLAAGACDPPTRAAIEQHLSRCLDCTARYAESQHLVGLLDLHWNQAALERLRQRVEQEVRPPRPPRPKRSFAPLVGGAACAAAVILLAVGLVWWLPVRDANRKADEPQFALLVRAGEGPVKLVPPLRDSAAPGNKGLEAMAVRVPGSKNGEALRKELLQAQRDGDLPPPPAVSLELTLVNNGERAVEVRLGDASPTLTLEVPGDGILRIPAPGAEVPAFLRPRSLRLGPGESSVISIDRLVAGSAGELEYIYLTEPGEYPVTARLHLTADGQALTVTGTPVRIKVGD
jgi:hypothetical protein